MTNYVENWLENKAEADYCYDKQNKLKSCDGCHDDDCPLIKRREICNEQTSI